MAKISLLFLGFCILSLECLVLTFCESTAIIYIASLFLLIFTYLSTECCNDGGRIEPFNKSVLITGCDSGFGHNLAKKLDLKGYHVFASCLFPDGEGANILKQTCTNRLKIVPLDVTKDESVEMARNFVTENLGSNVLWAIVNNAGVSKGFSVDFSTIQNFKDTFDVNTLGPVRVTKAFLPFLKKSKGRVINVTSAAGRISLPDLCAYVMSKHAALAFTECLSLEMHPWGVKVISIEPEAFRTEITNYETVSRFFDDTLKQIDKEIVSSYGEDYLEGLKKIFFKYCESSCRNISIVVDAIESAVSDKNPKHVYKPRRNLLHFIALTVGENLPRGMYETVIRIGQKMAGYPSLKGQGKD